MYNYFVSFSVAYPGKSGFGNTVASDYSKITKLEDIQKLTKDIEEAEKLPEGSVRIISFQVLES